jgi:hypothetical protein
VALGLPVGVSVPDVQRAHEGLPCSRAHRPCEPEEARASEARQRSVE